MKLSDSTVDILKNFATINQNILFEKGDKIATISPQRTVLAKAKLKDKFPQEFGIYDLNRFLGFVSRFNDPQYKFEDTCVNVDNGRKSGRYGFADSSIITFPNENQKKIKVKGAEIKFTLLADDLTEVLGDAAVLGLPEVGVEGNGKTIYLSAINSKDASSDTSKIPVGKTDASFVMVFKVENFKMVPRDYEVEISSKGIGHFTADDVEYFVSTEKNSTYEG